MENREVNLHTHTAVCKHGEGSIADYCRCAVTSGLKALGISEHNAYPDDRLISTRPFWQEMETYFEELEEAKKRFPELTILSALEVDVDEEFPLEFYRKEMLERFQLDYIFTGVHFVQDEKGNYIHVGLNSHLTIEAIRLFARKTVRLMESGLFDFIAHADFFCASVDEYTLEVEKCFREILEASLRTGVVLELNAYGFRKKLCEYKDGSVRHPYPWEPFWKLAAEEYRIPFVCFSDAHKPCDVLGNVPEVIAYGEKLGMSCVNARLLEKILKRKEGK